MLSSSLVLFSPLYALLLSSHFRITRCHTPLVASVAFASKHRERDREEYNFMCIKVEDLRNTQLRCHYLSIPPSSMSLLVTILGYPLSPPPETFLLNGYVSVVSSLSIFYKSSVLLQIQINSNIFSLILCLKKCCDSVIFQFHLKSYST